MAMIRPPLPRAGWLGADSTRQRLNAALVAA